MCSDLFMPPRVPFTGYSIVSRSEDDPTSKPLSVYAATKAAGEMLAFTYSHLYQLHRSVFASSLFSARGSVPIWPYGSLPRSFKLEVNYLFLAMAA